MIDDQYLRSFDRKYGVRTSGHVELSDTSFDASRLDDATAYGPVNAWALRKLLRILNLPKKSSFVDLGCGLGRACIIAGEYGFAKVTGVDLAPELCVVARENLAAIRADGRKSLPIQIIQGDVWDFCDQSEDDVYFMYRAFSHTFLNDIVKKLLQKAADRKKPLSIIYTERLSWPQSECVTVLTSNRRLRKIYEGSMLGQAFFVYRYDVQRS
jgi:SAM-dependent methyltransferase